MPKYLVQSSYIGDGIQGLRQEGGSARRAATEKACSSVAESLKRTTSRSAKRTCLRSWTCRTM